MSPRTSACSAIKEPSPALGEALNAGHRYLEVRCLGCDTHQTVALDIVRRPKTTPIHELERYMRCKDCSQVRLYAGTYDNSSWVKPDSHIFTRSAATWVGLPDDVDRFSGHLMDEKGNPQQPLRGKA